MLSSSFLLVCLSQSLCVARRIPGSLTNALAPAFRIPDNLVQSSLSTYPIWTRCHSKDSGQILPVLALPTYPGLSLADEHKWTRRDSHTDPTGWSQELAQKLPPPLDELGRPQESASLRIHIFPQSLPLAGVLPLRYHLMLSCVSTTQHQPLKSLAVSGRGRPAFPLLVVDSVMDPQARLLRALESVSYDHTSGPHTFSRRSGSSGSSAALVATPLLLSSDFPPNPSSPTLSVPWSLAFIHLISGIRWFSVPPGCP